MKNEVMGTEKIWKLVWSMTLPAIAAQIVNLLYSIVDRIYIGHIPEIGSTALTGVGLATPVIIIIGAFSAFVGNGGAPLASIALGKKDKEQAERIIGNGFTLLIILSIILPAVFLIFKQPFLYAIGASDATYDYAQKYLTIYLLGTFMVECTLGLSPFIIAQGYSKISMIIICIGAGLNIVLDPVFIYSFGMGVEGAAVATVISQTCSAVLVLYFLIRKAEIIRIKAKYMKLQKKILIGIASLGVSPFVMTITESLIGIVMNSGLQKYGGDNYVGCLTVMQSVMQFIGVPITGFTQGITPIISYNYGAGKMDRVKKAFYYSLGIMFTFSLGMMLLTSFFPGFFARIFTNEAELIALTTKSLPIFMAGMSIFGIQRACQTTFIALNQARVSLFIALLRKVFLLVPLAIILPRFFGVMGIYYAEPIADITSAITCGIIFAVTFRKILSGNTEDRREQ